MGHNNNENPDPQAQASAEPIAAAHLKKSLQTSEYKLLLNRSVINEHSLTAILPVTRRSLPYLRDTLESLAQPKTASIHLREILLVSQDAITSSLRSELFFIMSELNFTKHILCSIRSWKDTLSESTVLIQAAATSSTQWILILDENGLSKLSNDTQKILLSPPPTSLPLGLRGLRISHNTSCVTPTESPQEASYLIPPFVLPKSLCSSEHARSWPAFGAYLSSFRFSGVQAGGIILPQIQPDMTWCEMNEQPAKTIRSEVDPESLFDDWSSSLPLPLSDDSPMTFGILLLALDDLKSLSPVVCSLQQNGHAVEIALYEVGSNRIGFLEHSSCTLSYRALTLEETSFEWLGEMEEKPQIILTLSEMTDVLDACSSASSVIRIPRMDLARSTWMSTLTSQEWRDWNVPQVSLSVITKDRPQSLSRLLESISDAKFYGDKVDIRINLEQSSDLETLGIINDFRWNHGSMFVHHRVIHGGLLTAVAESWFPHSNDSYGVLLEDDVELSPFFYAWIKMALLRYRYGTNRGKNPQMFGISLYQPKNLELEMAGRRPFNASHILHSANFSAISPYLSPIPCSWGALYFPEHWKEFHGYLAIRFAEDGLNLSQIIVPDVRSNQWTKSWKKYFIELVYLRGYVMLYPNFPQYVSLSTNHLEVGSHVKIRSKEKRESFSVPLMKEEAGLLDLPSGSLPNWTSLPVLNITGTPTTLNTLFEIGVARCSELGLYVDTGYRDDAVGGHSQMCDVLHGL